MSQETIGIGIIGYGTVGSGVVQLLKNKAEDYARQLRRPLKLEKVLVRNLEKATSDGVLAADEVTTDIDAFFDDPAVDIVVELIGGTTTADDFVQRALRSGKPVVTANKALLAKKGAELFDLATAHGQCIGFEASCAGGIPIITALQFGLKANDVSGMYGILNGTSNYILSQMTSAGVSYEDALKDAQTKGYAEADPTLDVGGGDAAQKLAILSSLAFGQNLVEEDVVTSGIEQIEQADIVAGEELGYVIKLIAAADKTEDGLSLRVGPCFVPNDMILADVNDAYNALSVYGHAVGHTFYLGAGAGQLPTASAVMSDILNIASGWGKVAFMKMNTWLGQGVEKTLSDKDEFKTRYYLRILAKDTPGVVSQFSTILGEEGVSLAGIIQHEGYANGFVPVVITTHLSTVGSVQSAAARIASLDSIAAEPVCIRILDDPEHRML